MSLGNSKTLVAMICLVAACGHRGAAVVVSGNTVLSTPTPMAHSTKPDDDAARGNICIARDVRLACGLSADEAYFAFDLAYIREKSRKTFRALAECLLSGPLKGREIDLIGQVDLHGPRGRCESVARQRAANVRQIIVAESTHVNATSMIAMEAIDLTGASQSPWIEDGCIDVQCVDVVASRHDARALSLNE